MSLVAAFVKAHGGTVHKFNENHDSHGKFSSEGSSTKEDVFGRHKDTKYSRGNDKLIVSHNLDSGEVETNLTNKDKGSNKNWKHSSTQGASKFLEQNFGIKHKF